MSPTEFCFWLKTVLDRQTGDALFSQDVLLIRQTLSDVFRHAIDPSMGDETHLARLNRIHSGG